MNVRDVGWYLRVWLDRRINQVYAWWLRRMQAGDD
jgi:hypothetical protein